MTDRAKVVILGGGVSGCAIAYYLAEKGLTDLLVIDREKFIAAQATGKCAGGVRSQFSSDINCRMSLLSERRGTWRRYSIRSEGLPVRMQHR